MANVTLSKLLVPGYDGENCPAPESVPRVDHRDAFETRWPHQMLFATFWVEGDDIPPDVSFRLNKPSRAYVESHGYRILHEMVVVEVDYRPPEAMLPDPRVWGRYETRKGWRFFAELEQPIRPLHYEAQVRAAMGHMTSLGLVTDPKCCNWNRFWNLPYITHKKTGPTQATIIYPIEPLALVPEPAAAPAARHQAIPARGGERHGRTAQQRMDDARAWAATAPVSVAGASGDLTAWVTAQVVVRGFSLELPDAIDVLEDWNTRCQPPWEPGRMAYKAEEAERKGQVAWGSRYFLISRLRPPSMLASTPPDTSKTNQHGGEVTGYSLTTGPSTTPSQVPEGASSPPSTSPESSMKTNKSRKKEDEGGGGDEEGEADETPKKKRRKKNEGPNGEETYEVSDLELIDLMLNDAESAGTHLSALDGRLYHLEDDSAQWELVDKDQWQKWCQTWDRKSPDPTRYSPIHLPFARITNLWKFIAERLDCGRAIDKAVFYAQDGAVLLDHVPDEQQWTTRIEKRIPPISIVRLPGKWADPADCPQFLAFLSQVVPQQEMRDLIQEYIGACLLGRGVESQTVLCFEGPGGNGKGVLTNIIAKMFSPLHRCSITPQHMNTAEKLSSIKHARINLVGDLSSEMLRDPAGFKQVAAGDITMIRYLFNDPEYVNPKAGHVFSTNLPPETHDESAAFIRRWLIVYFGVRVADDKKIENLDSILWAAEAMGIVKWFYEGALRMARQGRVKIPAAAKQEMKDWSSQADPVRRVVEELLGTVVADADEKGGVASFLASEMSDRVNIKLVKDNNARASSKTLARYYRANGFVDKHTAKGTTWMRRTQ